MILRYFKVIIIFLLLNSISYAAQWPVAELLRKGGLDSEGNLSGTVGDSSQLSSDFGPRNVPGSRMHGGIDIPVPTGTPVYATVAGIVKKKGENGGYGYQIVIEGVDGRFHSYNHLIDDEDDRKNRKKYNKTFETFVKKKYKVTEGQQIGWSNDSGFSQGPHLDYKVYTKDNGRILYVNPLSVLPYTNNETPRVLIENPENGSEVGTDEKNREVEVNINVKTSEKDLTEVDLFIDSNRPPGVDFSFERKGRNKVAIEKNGTLYVYKYNKDADVKWNWFPATAQEKKNNKSYVQAGYVDAGTGSDDTFIYKWDTKAFLASKKVRFKKDVSIKSLAHQAKGNPGNSQIKVDVGSPSPLIDTLEIDKGILVAQVRYSKESPGLKSKLKPKEEGGKLTNEILEDRAVFKTASTVSEWTPDITINPDGTADLSAQTSGLEDGPHTAAIEILDENGNVTDSMQKIFYVDTKPPKLELVEPSGDEILHTQGSFLVKFGNERSGDILI